MTFNYGSAHGIQIRCPGCGESDSIGLESLGKRGRCRRCQLLFQIPAPAQPPALNVPIRAARMSGLTLALIIGGACVATAIVLIVTFLVYEHHRQEMENSIEETIATTSFDSQQPASSRQQVEMEREREPAEAKATRAPESESTAMPPIPQGSPTPQPSKSSGDLSIRGGSQ